MNTRQRRARTRGMMMLAAITLAACGADSDESTPVEAAEATEEAAATQDDDGAEGHDGQTEDHDGEDHDGEDHDHGELAEVTWAPVPSIALALDGDGEVWQGSISIENFTLTEGEVDPDPVDGEGHAHLYIDGFKDRRLYETTFTLEALDPGDHDIRVELVGNDHRTLAVDGVVIGASASVEAIGSDTAETDTAESDAAESDGAEAGAEAAAASVDADQVIVVQVLDGAVETQSREVDVALGSSVAIVVTSDVAEEVHVHGYDVFGDLTPGEPAVLEFEANIPGGFEVELEGRGQLLVELVVS